MKQYAFHYIYRSAFRIILPEGDVMTSSGTLPCTVSDPCPSHGNGETRGLLRVSLLSPRSVLAVVRTSRLGPYTNIRELRGKPGGGDTRESAR